jgi:transposase
MRKQKYHVNLTKEEKEELKGITTKGEHPARQITRARILLNLDGGELEQAEIAKRCQCSVGEILAVSRQYEQEGVKGVLTRKSSGKPSHIKADGEVQAKIITLACSEPPEGYAKWTLRLLEKESKVKIGIELSDTTIRNVLKKYAH